MSIIILIFASLIFSLFSLIQPAGTGVEEVKYEGTHPKNPCLPIRGGGESTR